LLYLLGGAALLALNGHLGVEVPCSIILQKRRFSE
jgi:hypothetical protein